MRILALARDNVSECARLLQVPRSTLQHYMTKYDISAHGLRAPQRS